MLIMKSLGAPISFKKTQYGFNVTWVDRNSFGLCREAFLEERGGRLSPSKSPPPPTRAKKFGTEAAQDNAASSPVISGNTATKPFSTFDVTITRLEPTSYLLLQETQSHITRQSTC